MNHIQYDVDIHNNIDILLCDHNNMEALTHTPPQYTKHFIGSQTIRDHLQISRDLTQTVTNLARSHSSGLWCYLIYYFYLALIYYKTTYKIGPYVHIAIFDMQLCSLFKKIK